MGFAAGHFGAHARVVAAFAVAACCAASLLIKVNVRYGEHPRLLYGDPATSYPVSDALVFTHTALNLIEGRGCGYYEKDFPSYSRMPPGHSFVLGAYLFYLGNNPAAIGWCVALLTSLLPWLGYLVSARMWGSRAVACVAAAMLAVYPVYNELGFTMLSEPTATATAAVALWLLARLVHERTFGNALAAGLAFGFASLVRPQPISLALAAAPWLMFFNVAPLRRRAAVLAVFIASMAAPPCAWSVRNRLVHGEFGMPYTTTSARQIWTGANPKYMPSFDGAKSHHELLWRDPEATELQRARRMTREAREFIRADPAKYAAACLRRNAFIGQLDFPLLGMGGRGSDHRYLPMAAGCALWLLAGIGCVKAVRQRTFGGAEGENRGRAVPGWIWSAILVEAMALFYIGSGVYGACDRYRWPTEVMLFPYAALGLAAMARIGSADFLDRWDTAFGPAHRPSPVRWIAAVAGGALAALVAAFAVGVAWKYVSPPDRVARTPFNTEESILAAITAAGVSGEFAAQQPRWIRYADVFADRAANGGMLSDKLRGRMVAWDVRALYPTFDVGGTLRSAHLTVNPSDTDIGGPTLELRWAGGRNPAADSLKSGDIVTVIGRLEGGDRPRTIPGIEGVAMVRGKFRTTSARQPPEP